MALTEQNSADREGLGPESGPDSDAGEVTREMAVGPLLARANLLRMRGQWDEAIAVCTEALRQAPRSPTAHSVLGDIYEAQGKYDDALQWYGMAVDLAPNRAADREKLERVVALQRGRLREIDTERRSGLEAHRAQMAGKLTPLSSSTGGTGGRAAAERTVEWFDRVFPPGRSESIARLVFALCGIIAVLIASAAVFVYTSSDRTRSASRIITEGGTSVGGLPTLTAPSPPVRVVVPSAAASPAAKNSPAPKASPSPTTAETPPASAAQTPQILSQLSQNLPPGVAVTALHGDGRVNILYRLEIALPRAPRETPDSTQERILRGAALAARTLALLDGRASQIIVGVSLREGVIPSDGFTSAQAHREIPVFQGTIAAATIREIDPAITPTAALQAQFSGISWSFPPYPATPSAIPTAPASGGPVPPASALAGPAPQ